MSNEQQEQVEVETIEAQEVETLSPEVIAQAKKLLEKKEKAGKDAMKNALRYPGVVADSIRFDPVAGKYSVEVICVQTGVKHRRYTSDLFQTKGLSPDAVKANKGEFKKAKKELLKKAMEAIRTGQIA